MERQEVESKLRRGELMLMEYMWREKSTLSKKEIEVAMKEKYKWRKSTTEILLGRLVKMRILKKKRVGFQLNYEVLVTKKEYLDVIKEEKDVSKYDNFFTQVFTTIHKKEEKTEKQIKVFIESMQKLGKK
mgnify:CR=1 FL=1